MPREGTGIRILHVDDDSSFLALTQAFLELGYEEFSVDTTTSAEEGLERLKSGNYDVVLSDYQMPTMDGLKFLQTLRERGNTIPFIIFTGRGREEVAIDALNKGANRYLQKGVDIDSMFGTLAYEIKDVATKNRAGEALRESEVRYRLLFNRGNDAVFVHEVTVDGVPGKIIDVNDVACSLLGYTREELLHLSHLDLLASEELTRVPGIREKLQANGSNLFGIVVATKYGKRLVFEINNHLFTLNGQPTVLAIARDITERKKAEEELQQSEEMYRTLFEDTGTAMIIIEEDMTISHINDEMVKVSGYSKEEIEGRVKWPELVVQDDLERMKEYHRLRRSDPAATPTSYDFQFTHKQGDVRDAVLTATVIPGTKKSVISIKDITDRKQMENELRRSESLYRTLFEATGVPTVILDEAGMFYQVNAEGAKISGFTKEELECKKNWTEFIATREDLERMREIHRLRRTEPDNAPMNYDFLFRDRYGNLRNIYVTAALIPGTKKSVVSFLDITERKRAEEALQESRQEYQTIFETTGTTTGIIEEDMTISRVNREFEKQLGYSKEEVEGKKKWPEFVGEEDVERMLEYHRLRRTDPNAAPSSYECLVRDKQGNVKNALLTLDMIPGTKKSVASFLDITERKRAEEALRESEEKYKAIVEHAPFGISIMNPDTSFEYFNPIFTTMCGYTLDDLPDKKTWFEKAYPDEEYRKKVVSIWKEDTAENFKTLDLKPRVFNVRCKDGQDKIIHFRTALLVEGRHFLTYQDMTEQAKAEEVLKEKEREHQVLLDHVPVSLFHIDLNSTFVHVNEALAKRYGKKPEDVIGKNTRELFPEEAESFIESDREILACGDPHIGELRKIKTPKGVRWVRLDKVPLKDAEGNVTGIIGFELDITKLKRIEEKLQEREREYQTVLDSVPVGIYHIDAESRFIHVNKALAERYGMTPEDFKGKTSRELFPDGGEEYLESDKEVLESGVPQRGVTSKLATPEGEKWVRLDKVPLQDPEGNITDIVGFELDITERIETQEELRNAHKKMQDIVEFLPDATFVIDRDMKVIAWNRAIEEMTGIPKDDIIGKGDYEYALPFYGERRPILTDLVFSRSDGIESRYAHVGKKGSTLFAEVYSPFMYGGKGAHLWGIATPLYDPEGNVVGAIESVRDITERKRAEKERDGLLKELETKNREMGHFTYTVSHDLRSPLVTIQGFTTMLQKDIEQNERERAENDLKHIESAVTKMSALLSDTLELSRIGRIANPPEDVPFGDIVEDALELTSGDLNAHDIDVYAAEDFPTVHVDRMRIVEVLGNLITNSIKYRGDQPQPKIEIGYRVDDKDTVFFVKDNGIGVDKSQYEKVFELFYRVNKGGEGTGAGLAIVKRIIEVHGGRIWIESETGKGCTVCFTLPVR